MNFGKSNMINILCLLILGSYTECGSLSLSKHKNRQESQTLSFVLYTLGVQTKVEVVKLEREKKVRRIRGLLSPFH